MPNLQLFIDGEFGEEKFIDMTISNVGGQPTTLERVVIFGYKNRLSYIRNKHSSIGTVLRLGQSTPPLPYLLELGSTWATQINQTEVEETIEKKALKFIAIGVYYSSSKKPKLNRLNME